MGSSGEAVHFACRPSVEVRKLMADGDLSTPLATLISSLLCSTSY